MKTSRRKTSEAFKRKAGAVAAVVDARVGVRACGGRARSDGGRPGEQDPESQPRTRRCSVELASCGRRKTQAPACPTRTRLLVFSKPTESYGGILGIGTLIYGRINPCNLARLGLLAGCRGLREMQG